MPQSARPKEVLDRLEEVLVDRPCFDTGKFVKHLGLIRAVAQQRVHALFKVSMACRLRTFDQRGRPVPATLPTASVLPAVGCDVGQHRAIETLQLRIESPEHLVQMKQDCIPRRRICFRTFVLITDTAGHGR